MPAPRASGPQRRRLIDRPRPAVGLESRCCGVISLDRDGVRNALVLARDRRGEGTLGAHCRAIGLRGVPGVRVRRSSMR